MEIPYCPKNFSKQSVKKFDEFTDSLYNIISYNRIYVYIYIYIYTYISKYKNTLIYHKYFGCFQNLLHCHIYIYIYQKE